MEEKRLYLVGTLDAAAERSLDALVGVLIRLGLCQNPPLGIPFHITLASLAITDEAEALRRARAVCARTPPFPIRLNNIGLFGLKVLFVAPAVNRELLALHDALAPGEPAEGAHTYAPHVTLLMDEPAGHVQKATLYAAEAFAPMDAWVESVSVYEYPPARFLDRFALEG